MSPDEPKWDEADAERLMNLIGDLHMAIGRARHAGAAIDDVLVCFGQAIGEFCADELLAVPVTLVMTNVAITAQRAHHYRLKQQRQLGGKPGEPG
jgi:hypothetical protein